MSINNYNNFLSKITQNNIYDFKNKSTSTDIHRKMMLNRCLQMFEYAGLPDTIPQRDLELQLMCGGCVAVTEVDGELYSFNGGLGGEPNVYYMPTIFTVSNPALKFSANLKIDKDCIVIPSDSLYLGLLPIIDKYSSFLTETELSIYLNIINTRIIQVFTASDDDTKKSAELFLQHIQQGDLGVIAENAFLDGLRVQQYATANTTTQDLIECLQYLRATFFHEIGINANYNMKRETLNTSETSVNEQALLPLLDDMLKQRKKGFERVNEKYGTNISVKLNSIWENKERVSRETTDEKATSPTWL